VQYEAGGSFLSRVQQLVDAGKPGAPEAPAAADEASEDVDAADEAAGEGAASPGDAAPAEAGPAPSSEAGVQAAAAPAAAPLAPADLARLASMVSITPRPDGGVHIEAPREAAVALATLLQTLAQGLMAAGRQ
jgi:hypothetical protein